MALTYLEDDRELLPSDWQLASSSSLTSYFTKHYPGLQVLGASTTAKLGSFTLVFPEKCDFLMSSSKVNEALV